MDSLEFIAILTTFAVVLAWYLINENAGASGERGPLALAPDESDLEHSNGRARSYRMKKRIARRARDRRGDESAADAETSDKAERDAAQRLDERLRAIARMRRKFRRQDEARYRVKDKAPDNRRPPETDAD